MPICFSNGELSASLLDYSSNYASEDFGPGIANPNASELLWRWSGLRWGGGGGGGNVVVVAIAAAAAGHGACNRRCCSRSSRQSEEQLDGLPFWGAVARYPGSGMHFYVSHPQHACSLAVLGGAARRVRAEAAVA